MYIFSNQEFLESTMITFKSVIQSKLLEFNTRID